MLAIIIIIALIWVAWKILVLGMKTAWGLTKILGILVLLPLLIFAFVGLAKFAIPLLIIVAIIGAIGGMNKAKKKIEISKNLERK